MQLIYCDAVNGELAFFKSKSQDQGLFPFTKCFFSYISSFFDTQVVGSILQLLYEELSFGTDALEAWMGPFVSFMRQIPTNCKE